MKIDRLSNNQIRKLGDRLRDASCRAEFIHSEDFKHLQSFRKSHKDSLTSVFQDLSLISRNIHNGRIQSFRIKKIDTILSKLVREPDMELDRMWDIAGCRVIVQSETAVYKILKELKTKFEIKKNDIKDRIRKPAKDGYRAVHVYLKPNIENAKKVEIQIRTFEQHYWATLVEIIDVIYGTKIKEGDSNKSELNEFLKLYANKKSKNMVDIFRMLNIEQKFNVYQGMVETFAKNITQLRKDWIKIDVPIDKPCYVLFEVDKNNTLAKLELYPVFEEAELEYYHRFKNANSDVFISHLDVHDFKQLGIAYSNYVLTSHNFLEDWKKIMFEAIKNQLKNKSYIEAEKNSQVFNEILNKEETLYLEEMLALGAVVFTARPEKDTDKLRSWIRDQEAKKVLNNKRRDELRVLLKDNFIDYKKADYSTSLLGRIIKWLVSDK